MSGQIVNEVTQCVESINGVKEGRWKATLTFYKPMLRGKIPIIPILVIVSLYVKISVFLFLVCFGILVLRIYIRAGFSCGIPS